MKAGPGSGWPRGVSSLGAGCRRAGLAAGGSSSTVRGPRLRPPWPLHHTRVREPRVCVQRSEWAQPWGKEEAQRKRGCSSQASCRRRKQAASWSADLSEAVAPVDKAASCPRTRPGGPREGTCRHPPSVTPTTRALLHRCVHTPPAPGTSGHIWGAAGGAGARLGVSHRVVCPHPPPGTRAGVPSPRVPGGCVWGRGPEFGPTRPPPLLQPLPWPLCDPRPLLPSCVTGTAPDGRAEAHSEWRGLSMGRSCRTACLQLPGWQLGSGRDQGFHTAVGRWVHSSGHWAGTLCSLGADHAPAQCGGAGQAGGGDSCGCSLEGPWEGSGARQTGAGDWVCGHHPHSEEPCLSLPLSRCPCLALLNILASPKIFLPLGVQEPVCGPA